MYLVGLTGGIGAGKSTVARLLAQRGAVVIDADPLAREVVAPGTPGLAEVRPRFGRVRAPGRRHARPESPGRQGVRPIPTSCRRSTRSCIPGWRRSSASG